MSDKETLIAYRLRQAEETLDDAEKMLKGGFSTRSIASRAYYAMFYSLLALFLKTNIALKTSKHSGVISIFDKEFVHTDKIDRRYSKLLHKAFEVRQEADYKELFEISYDEAVEIVRDAKEFLEQIKNLKL